MPGRYERSPAPPNLLQRKNDFNMTKKGAEAPLIKYI